MNKFVWGGMDKPGVNLDENCVRMTGNLRMQMGILANALIAEGKKDKAKKVLDKCIEKMPDENIPFDGTIFSICRAYYEVGDTTSGNNLAKKLFDIFEGDLNIYRTQKSNRISAYGREINQAKEILKMLASTAQQFRQEKLYKEFLQRLGGVLSEEDMAPVQQQPQQQIQQ
jgi:hypothetical protein